MLHDFTQGLPEGFEEVYPIRRGSTVAAVDWNKPTRPIDLDVWSKQTSNFWLPEKIPLSNDLKSWDLLDEGTQRVVTHSLASLTRLDTLQAEFGAPCLLSSPGITPHESANLSFITGMEAVHARSYSSIFSTLLPSDKIDEAFKLANMDGLLSSEMDYFLTAYQGSQIDVLADSLPGSTLTALKAATSVMLESFLFYTGFYPVLKLAAEAKLTNTADIIRLIMRDEAVHGFYIGGIFERLREEVSEDDETADIWPRIESYVEDSIESLFAAEKQRIEQYYSWSDVCKYWIPDALQFLGYNGKMAASNLGDSDYAKNLGDYGDNVSAVILSQLSTVSDENHDYFSGSGSAYVIGTVESVTDDDWN